MPSFTRDVFPGLGIGAAAFGVEILMLIPLAPFINEHSKLIHTVSTGNVPKYYLIEGIFMSAATAITEEVLGQRVPEHPALPTGLVTAGIVAR